MATGLTRRACLAAPWALAGCGPRGASAQLEGGWLGVAHVRGHRLREAAGSASAASSASTPASAAASASAAAPKRCAVAIVGGGVAGLAAARALLRAGIEDIALFELEDTAGGNARAHQMHGIPCPQGAHYLPLPGPQAHEVSELLHDFGLLRSVHGRTQADERHLCHSPQERLWVDGQWVEGLLPPAAAGSAREAQYRRFAQRVAAVSRELAFAMPSHRAGWTAGHAALDHITFAQWLQQQGLDDPALRWYLNYACRDDYGADASAVSAWAGLHYFNSRHGFHLPGDDDAPEREAVFTWPEGNAWLTRRLAAPLGDRLHNASLVRHVDVQRHGVVLDVERFPQHGTERWTAQQVVLALPLHVAARVLANPPSALVQAAAQVPHAPWLVANLHLHAPLLDVPGAPPAWDNVLFATGLSTGTNTSTNTATALGYVDAMHQSLRPMPGPTVLTAYWALGDANAQQMQNQRRDLLHLPWQTWAQRVLADLGRAHPDLPGKTTRVDLTRYGHAMAIPAPGVRGSAALRALAAPGAAPRLHFAHSDLAAYSVFEEAYTLGVAAGLAAALQLANSPRTTSRL